MIGSGPTVPDPTTCADALAILDALRASRSPPAIRAGLESGALETPKPGDAVFAGNDVHLIATPQQSLEAAAALARAAGIEAHILERRDRRRVARGRQGARGAGAPGRAPRPAVRAALRHPLGRRDDGDGEARRAGRGGRATEFLLGCALALQGEPSVWALAADTDGIDGVESNAGAFVTPDTLARARGARPERRAITSTATTPTRSSRRSATCS